MLWVGLVDTTAAIGEFQYPITTFIEPQPKTTADATLYGPGDADRTSAGFGVIKVSDLTATNIKGTFRLDFGGSIVEGGFDGPLCPAVWNF